MTEKISSIAIEEKMKEAYLNYSLSVIVSRALPDVRDGLKPVHRRILYAAKELGLTHDKDHKKSARIVGEVLGKYHPHGDQAVYNAMVRMAQDFNQRYKLIDGHGNFGSIDGDSAAAMRYTEAKLTEMSDYILKDLKKETVPFSDNFDGSLKEPDIVPSRLPNILINGSSGIAVGMSTDIPPHNLNEVADAIIALIKKPNLSIDKIIDKYISGPDFPTGGTIVGNDGIKEAYKKGKGKLNIRGKTKEEKVGRHKQIVIYEIPFQVNKSKLIEEIAKYINKGKLEEVRDLRDETDKEGLRIVIELKQGADTNIVLNRLYKYTSLQNSYRINLLALIDNKPEVMNILKMLKYFIRFRRKVITKRSKYELDQLQSRLHLLEGLMKAIDKLDLVISIIRNSESAEKAHKKLVFKLKISDKQAQAILNMQLRRLVGMEIEKLETEVSKLKGEIKELQSILGNQKKLDEVIIEETKEVKEKFGDKRRTDILSDEKKAVITKQDLIEEKEAVVSYSLRQNIKRNSDMSNMRASKNDYILELMRGSSYDKLLFFSESGQVYNLSIHDIEEHHGLSTGEPLNKYLKVPMNEKIIKVICLNDDLKEKYIDILTVNGKVKRTLGKEYDSNYSSINAIKLEKGDKVVDVIESSGGNDLIIGTDNGKTIRFDEDSVSSTGRYTMGSSGIKLDDNKAIFMDKVNDYDYLVSISEGGKVNKISVKNFQNQNRNGKGRNTSKSGDYSMHSMVLAKADDDILIITEENKMVKLNVSDVSETQLPGYMYKIKGLSKQDTLKSVYRLPKIEIDEESDES
ncbi:MAG: DNA topoisomerase (ATP-hydrolyzing) subunit A [Bacillota bacterium]